MKSLYAGNDQIDMTIVVSILLRAARLEPGESPLRAGKAKTSRTLIVNVGDTNVHDYLLLLSVVEKMIVSCYLL